MARVVPSQEALKAVSTLLEQGRLAECERAARALVAEHPEHATSWNFLGVCLAVSGRIAEALTPLQRVTELDPGDAEAQRLVADVLHRLGRLGEAEAAYARSLALRPDAAQVLASRGNTLAALGRLREAEADLRHALALAPGEAQAHANLGFVLRELGRPAEAEASCRRAIELKPTAFRAHNNLGNALKDLGRLAEAEASYRHAIERKPDYAVAHANLASLLHAIGRPAEAEASGRRAIELNPRDAAAHVVLGVVLAASCRFTEARAIFVHATELDERSVDGHNGLGNVLRELGDPASGERELRAALALAPGRHEVHSNLLFSLHFRPHSAEESLEAARAYGVRVTAEVGRPIGARRGEAAPQRLRVGLVSGDLCEHVVAHFLEGVLANLDRARIELFAYPARAIDDARSRRLRASCAHWTPLVGLDDDAAAAAIHRDGIHVLVDLSGHTAHNRLPIFARRPAPVQASWLGYFDTTGLPQIDWVLADEVSVPAAARARFTERIWYLPDSRLCFTPPEGAPAVAPLPALDARSFTYGCFQELAKVNDQVLSAFGRILHARPDARLRLQARALGDAEVRETLRSRLRAQGLAPDRVELHGPMPREAYLAAYASVDALLDTFPYPGGTTTCEALWMGLPTLTLAGDDMLARQGAALMSAVGLSDWVANDEEQYVAKAIALPSDVRALAALRSSLRDRAASSPVFDAPRFARNLEAALFGMWRDVSAA